MNGHTCETEANDGYVVGDLLWTKIGHYPYWPCMVTYDPTEGCFSKERKVRNVYKTIYHVQYFGKMVQRGWTAPGSTFPFEGEKKFYAKKEEAIKAAANVSSNAQKQVESKYNVPGGSLKDWHFAVKEAEGSYAVVNTRERFESYVFKYEQKKHSATNGTLPLKRNDSFKLENEVGLKPKKIKTNEEDTELVCKICEKEGAELSCSGACLQSYHTECLGLICAPQTFTCCECALGTSSCFVCKRSYGSIVKCAAMKCSKYYHMDCVKNYDGMNKERKICPLHTCVTCYRENPKNIMSRKGPFIQCIRCPTAFHTNESCLAAGSVELNSSSLICPEHYLGKNKFSPLPTCNISYCFICSLGGELICCENCPHAYHASCIDDKIPEGDFFCPDCLDRKYLCYGMIIWAKVGHYRWWPCKIMHPSEIPTNIEKLQHYDGDFPVRFFGSYEYAWIHKGRAIAYAEHHKEFHKIPGSSSLAVKFNKGIEEAAKAYDEYLEIRLSESSIDEKPEEYKHIKVNKAVPPAQISTIDDKCALQCSCSANKRNPCGPESLCLNRSMLIECHPDVCKAKDLCQNQKFQRRQYVSAKIIKTRNRGWGLITQQHVKKGEFVIEYVGEVITHMEYKRRSKEMQEKNIRNFYFLYLDSRRMIDAGPRGNLARFINHSCSPNCEMVKWSVNGDARIGIFAVTDISSGEELTFNYQCDIVGFEQKCNCLALNCQGVIGKLQPSNSFIEVAKLNGSRTSKASKVSIIKPKRKKKIGATAVNGQLEEKETDNHCFVCKSPGNLMMCDYKTCTRSYHTRCVKLPAVPKGDWICPWHFCTVCKKTSVMLCKSCVNSYCGDHLNNTYCYNTENCKSCGVVLRERGEL